MALELTLAGIAGSVLTEGVKFLYLQAGELIKEWRQRKQEDQASPERTPTDFERRSPPQDSFDGPVLEGMPDLEALARVEQALAQALEQPVLVRIGVLGDAADTGDPEQLQAFDRLRSLMETVYGQAITFKGEVGRLPSGTPVVRGEAHAESLRGLQAGMDVDEIAGGSVEGSATASIVEPGGQNIGVRAKRIG